MPIELFDDAGEPVDLDKASGGFLRSKLEEAIERNKVLEQSATTAAATTAISEHGYTLVKPEDLVGVPLEQVEAKAKEIHEANLATRTETIRSVLVERGLKDEELEAALKGVLGDTGKPVEPEKDPSPNFAGLGKIGGLRPDNTGDAPPMDDSMANLTEHFTDQLK